MFSEYCENKFEVEPVEVISYDGSKAIYPDLSCYKMEASISEILGRIGISLDETQVYFVRLKDGTAYLLRYTGTSYPDNI
jgi:hypothetical protein